MPSAHTWFTHAGNWAALPPPGRGEKADRWLKPLFRLEACEWLVGEEVERRLKRRGARVWVPAKDTGIDLLVTSRDLSRAVQRPTRAQLHGYLDAWGQLEGMLRH